MGSEQFCLKWSDYQNNFMSVFSLLLENNEFVDVTLVCGDQSFKAHKLILAACSPFFQSIFKDNPCKHPVIVMKDTKHSHMNAILEFMYKGEITIDQEQLPELLKTGDALKIKGLSNVYSETNDHDFAKSEPNRNNDFGNDEQPILYPTKKRSRKYIDMSNDEQIIQRLQNDNNEITINRTSDIGESQFPLSRKRMNSNFSHEYVTSFNENNSRENICFDNSSAYPSRLKEHLNDEEPKEYLFDSPSDLSQRLYGSSSAEVSIVKQESTSPSLDEQRSFEIVGAPPDFHEVSKSSKIEVSNTPSEKSKDAMLQNLSNQSMNYDQLPPSQSKEGFTCTTCGNMFSSNSSLKRHVQSIHLKHRVSCPICGSLFTQKPSMERHLEQVHCVPKKK